ncbi:MAG: methyltransferase domain-containing protein [Planctomycetes bacterium]|nr:methyltransferase domain-containing protein [Planctomycetota bacterium]
MLEQLRCPDCAASLSLVEGGRLLNCTSCGRSFSVADGIPRFVEQQHLASFGHQWNKYEVAHDDEDRATFQAKTGFSLDELAGRRILDAGCGGGRYAKVAAEAGAEVVAADQSTAVEKAAELCRSLPNVCCLQSDLKRLPLPQESFDDVFSIGVMHHDVDTRAVFDAVAKMVKPGGRMSVWLYRRNQWWQECLNNAIRRRSTRMKPERLEKWCRFGAWLGGIPLVNQTLNKIVNFSNHPDCENRLCDTYDWYAPMYQNHHTVTELKRWFEDAGFEDLTVLPPEKSGRFYRWIYNRNLLIGSGVNVTARRKRTLS